MNSRLYRSRRDRMLFGVAGGIARYLDLDPSIVRIGWVLLVFAGGAGILLYIIAAIVIPEEPEAWTAAAGTAPPGAGAEPGMPAGATPGDAGATPPWSYRAGVERRGAGGGAILIGVVLVIIGAWFLLRRVVPAIDSDLIWPVVLVGFGAALLIGAMRRS